MSQRMYVDNIYIFGNSETDLENSTINNVCQFLSDQPERYIEDEAFWEDLKSIAYERGEYGDCFPIIVGHTEFDRTFMLLILYGDKEMYFFSFWWNGSKTFDIQTVSDVSNVSKSRDFMVAYGKGGIGVSCTEEMHDFLAKQYEEERICIKKNTEMMGGKLIQPLHYVKA